MKLPNLQDLVKITLKDVAVNHMEIKFSPLVEVQDLLPLSLERLAVLPDIIDIRCGRVGISFYLYPVASWHWGFNVEKQTVSMNSLTPWINKYCYEITIPTVHIEFTLS